MTPARRRQFSFHGNAIRAFATALILVSIPVASGGEPRSPEVKAAEGAAERPVVGVSAGQYLGVVNGLREIPEANVLTRLVLYGTIGEFRAALMRGANPNETFKGIPVLILALRFRDPRFALVLLNGGADANSKLATQNLTSLMVAASFSSDLKVLSALRGSLGNVDAADTNGYTALHHAVSNRNLVSVKFLLDTGRANANTKTIAGLAPLYLALLLGDVDSARLLAKHGALLTEPKDKRYPSTNSLCKRRKPLLEFICAFPASNARLRGQ